MAPERRGLPLDRARVVIQGFGSVGQHVARHLAAAGARIVAVGDSRGAVHAPDGLALDALLALERAGRSVAEHVGAARIASEGLVAVECDLWVPAARPDAIHDGNVAELRARFVVPGANIAVTAGAEAVLHERGVVCVPDFIANAGGVICAALEHRGQSRGAAFEAIRETVSENTAQVLEAAERERHPPRAAAMQRAAAAVKKAMAWRRWSASGASTPPLGAGGR